MYNSIKTLNIMNTKEIRERFTPQLFETQQEYKEWYTAIDEAQTQANHPFVDKCNELHVKIQQLSARKHAVEIEVHAIKVEIATLYAEIGAHNGERKEMNREFHALKHECAQLNPKDELQPVEHFDPA